MMIKNYLKIASRNLWKQKGYTAINLFGMAVGLMCCFLILLYVRHERQYDRFHESVDRLYRVNYQAKFSGSTFELTRIPAPIGPRLVDNFPQIETAARFYPRSISVRDPEQDRQIEIPNALFADSTATQVFDFEFVQGNPEQALQEPFTVVLTEETAERFFGTRQALGRTLLLAGQQQPFKVNAVVRDFPEQAHLHFDLLVPFSNIVDTEPDYARESILIAQNANWIASYTYTYVRLREGTSSGAVDAAFPDFLKRFGDPNFIDKQAFVLFPVSEIHLLSEAEGEPEPVANLAYLRLFAIVGLLILLIAAINFINLSNAIYLDRMKEVAVRKVLGAGKGGLISQLVSEAVLICIFACILALIGVSLVLPYLNALTARTISFNLLGNWPQTALFAGIALVTGLLAGLYPAVIASRFQPARIFQHHTGHTGGRQWLRKSLITIQFIVGIALLSGTFVILSQLRYWENMPLGFERNQVLAVPLFSPNMNAAFMPGDSTLRGRTLAFEEKLLQHPQIEAITQASNLPGVGAVRHPITTDKITVEDNVFLPCISADYDFAQTFGLQILEGRNFGKEYGSDHIDAFIINEMAVKTLGWNSPAEAIGKSMTKGGKRGHIVGVVNNFHTRGLQAALEPVIMDVGVGAFTTFAIRVKQDNIPATLDLIERHWKDYFPEKAFEYAFLDDNLQLAYQEEQRLASLIGYFSAIAIFLSCFGLFGLISFTIHQKAKEIGIRKILGASVAGIVGMLSKGYLLLVGLALLVAAPLTWYFMQQWLETFSYHIQVPWWIFLLSGLAAILIAFITISIQSVRAALGSPVKSLRSD
ncbi:MAG: ABC transporter permease [Bacteroidetes bacterium]|nr:MAG: ABC transporter permease [Bacteroidota bacterium]